MLDFRDIRLEDKNWIKELLSYSDYRGCEYTFGNNFIWSEPFDIRITRFKDFYIVQSEGEFFYPAGRGDFKEVVEELRAYRRQQGRRLCFGSAPRLGAEYLKETYGDGIEIYSNPDFFDYCYNYEDLAALIGKKYHSKRNFINRFIQNDWSYEAVTAENTADCMTLLEQWKEENSETKDPSMEQEVQAAKKGLEYFEQLDFRGGLLRVEGKPVAFTFGEGINSDTFDVHVEKALSDYDGTYPMINREFVNHSCSDYKYINREEDVGEENLRKAKLSYHPAFMEEKFRIIFKD
ncbi:MAG: phosphatidylglycerol lysyltransferase domain-containing protein [Bacteroides sp.]|nr:phosphatidylglycerol lysyltransferase domain-containing protein [Bacteroides sp.]